MLTAEQAEIRALARDFARNELRPSSARWDAAGAPGPGVLEALAELGFLGMAVPEGHGGLGLDAVTSFLVVEALAEGDPAVARAVALHGAVAGAVALHGTPEERERWCGPLAHGESLAGLLLPRTDGGRTPRVSAGPEGRVLEGVEGRVPHAQRLGLLLVLAPPSAAPETGGLAAEHALLVDPGAPGVELGEAAAPMGLCASEVRRVRLDAVPVPEGLGGGDPAAAADVRARTRLGMAAVALGIAGAAREHAARYAAEREQFGRSIADFGAIQAKLARMAARTAAARALALEAARERGGEAGRPGGGHEPDDDTLGPASRVALAKVVASEAAMYAADEAVQIFGGYGYMRDYPVEKLMRDAKGTEIHEEPNETLRTVAARAIVRAAREAAS